MPPAQSATWMTAGMMRVTHHSCNGVAHLLYWSLHSLFGTVAH
jgi:hypothetical protein